MLHVVIAGRIQNYKNKEIKIQDAGNLDLHLVFRVIVSVLFLGLLAGRANINIYSEEFNDTLMTTNFIIIIIIIIN